MKKYIISLSFIVFIMSFYLTGSALAEEANVLTIDSFYANASNPGYISNAGKTNITVAGNAPKGSMITITLTDSAKNTLTYSKTMFDSTLYQTNFDGTRAIPKPLIDGLITVTVYAKTSGASITETTVTKNLIQITTPPTIYIIGDNPFYCMLRGVCVDLGAVAFDIFGNKIPVTALNSIRTSTEGNYAIRYGATDFAGNEALTVARTVSVSRRTTGLSTTTPDMSNIPNPTPIIISTSSPTVVENVIKQVESTPIIKTEEAPTITVIKVSGVSDTIKRQLRVGMSGADIKLLQTLLSHDTSIYPEGLTSGYFGNLTQKAVQRFQEKYGVVSSGGAGYGQVGPKTKAKLIEIFGN